MEVMGGVGVLGGIMVIREKNAVYGVLYLIGIFINMAGILLIMKVEYIGLLLIVVYVGAIAVLFVFIVMMLIPREEIREERNRIIEKIIIGGLIIGVISMTRKEEEEERVIKIGKEWIKIIEGGNNITEIGEGLYGGYLGEVLIGGLILLLGLIGAIRLTRWNKEERKKE